VGETRVDLLHLLEDLRDAYPGALEETILTEIVANELDSGAGRIRLHTDAGRATLAVVDDGCGMRRQELARYHDVAASTKARGEGIGFAGVGIELSLEPEGEHGFVTAFLASWGEALGRAAGRKRRAQRSSV